MFTNGTKASMEAENVYASDDHQRLMMTRQENQRISARTNCNLLQVFLRFIFKHFSYNSGAQISHKGRAYVEEYVRKKL